MDAAVITTALAISVASPRARVWRALTDPAEMIRWDESLLALMEPAEGFPQVGQHVKWRCSVGTVPVVLHDRPFEVVCQERLRSKVAMGLFRFEQTWSLADDEGRTRLGLSITAENSIPVVGGSVDRFDVRRMAAEYVDTRLRALQKWCEVHS